MNTKIDVDKTNYRIVPTEGYRFCSIRVGQFHFLDLLLSDLPGLRLSTGDHVIVHLRKSPEPTSWENNVVHNAHERKPRASADSIHFKGSRQNFCRQWLITQVYEDNVTMTHDTSGRSTGQFESAHWRPAEAV